MANDGREFFLYILSIFFSVIPFVFSSPPNAKSKCVILRRHQNKALWRPSTRILFLLPMYVRLFFGKETGVFGNKGDRKSVV